MKKLVASLCVAGAVALPGLVQARPLTLNTQMQAYSGNEAYLAIYVTDANGKFKQTLWVAGKKAKYYKNLRDWTRGGGSKASQLDGVTGASVGSGETLKITVDLADVLIDAGNEIRIDTAVEDKRDIPADVRVPLTAAGAGKPVAGRGYVKSFTYGL